MMPQNHILFLSYLKVNVLIFVLLFFIQYISQSKILKHLLLVDFLLFEKKRNKTFEPIVELLRGYRSDHILFPDSDNDSESRFE